MQQSEQIFPKKQLTDFELSVNDLLADYNKEELHNDLDTFMAHEMEAMIDNFNPGSAQEDIDLDKEDIRRRLSLYFFMQKTLRTIRRTYSDRNISSN